MPTESAGIPIRRSGGSSGGRLGHAQRVRPIPRRRAGSAEGAGLALPGLSVVPGMVPLRRGCPAGLCCLRVACCDMPGWKGGNMRYIGIDLAWGPSGVTGLAALDERGHLLDAVPARTDAEIVSWLGLVTAGRCLVAIDAPIIVPNASGSRRCERLVGQYFGRYGASCHSSNTANPAFASGSRALRLASQLGLDTDPVSAASRRAIEVYPHPAIVALFALPSIIKYKAKPGRSTVYLRAEMLRLIEQIEGLEADSRAPLRVRQCAAWQQIRESVASAVTKAALKRAEDSIDAVVCAYIARFADACPDKIRVLGGRDDGYIVTPVTPEIATQIDAGDRGAVTVAECLPGGDGLAGELILALDVAGRPASYSSAAQQPWQAAVRAAVAREHTTPRRARFGVRISFRTPVQTTANDVWDLDNLIKPTLDAMEAVFGLRPWGGRPQAADDRVDYLQATKRTVRHGEPPGARIEVYALRR
jgi:predicted RNase H-like nuclease